jgi:hypothetical protein
MSSAKRAGVGVCAMSDLAVPDAKLDHPQYGTARAGRKVGNPIKPAMKPDPNPALKTQPSGDPKLYPLQFRP